MPRFATIFLFSTLFGQTVDEFEVATIKPAPPQAMGVTSTRMSSDTEKGKLSYTNVNVRQVIGKAYQVQPDRVGGPGWMDTDRFDIVARFPPDPKADNDTRVPRMLQALLADRFKLTLHRETKELPIYTLAIAKNGPKLKKAETESGITSKSNRASWHVVAKVSMPALTEFLAGQVGRPVVDKTGLTGSYEVTLDWALPDAPADANAGPSIFTALQEQLGLKLESAKGPVETLVVDHADRVPSEN